MNSYIFHIYFIYNIFSSKTHLIFILYMLDVAISLHTWILLLSKYGEGVANYSHTYEYTHTHKKKQQKRKKKEKGVGGRKKEQNQKKKKEEKERERGKEKRRTKKEGGNGVGKVEERGY